jgi:hypothetical protein
MSWGPLEPDLVLVEVVEEANPAAQQHRRQRDHHLVDEPGEQACGATTLSGDGGTCFQPSGTSRMPPSASMRSMLCVRSWCAFYFEPNRLGSKQVNMDP